MGYLGICLGHGGRNAVYMCGGVCRSKNDSCYQFRRVRELRNRRNIVEEPRTGNDFSYGCRRYMRPGDALRMKPVTLFSRRIPQL